MAENENTSKAISQFPFMFDSTTLPFFPGDWSRANNPLRNIIQSEGGQDMMQTVRNRKLTISFATSVADDTWAGFFEEYSEKSTFQVKVYSPQTHGYDTLTMRMEGFNCKPHKKSEKLTEVAGVWDVSFTLVEM